MGYSIYELESILSQEQSRNRELKNDLEEIESCVKRNKKTLAELNELIRNRLNDSANLLQDSQNKEIEAIEVQGKIEKLYNNFKSMEVANKKIRELNQKKYYEFKNFRAIRKIVQGLMDNLDLAMVTDKAIYKSVEKEHLMTPNYWLTSVLIAIMAWKNDDKGVATRAIDLAVSLDKKNTAVFLMLFNLRMDRLDASVKWFNCFTECELNGSDQHTFLMLFSLLSDSLEERIDIGDNGRAKIKSYIDSVLNAGREESNYDKKELLKAIIGFYRRMTPKMVVPYPLLQKYCTNFTSLNNAYIYSHENIAILEFLKKAAHVNKNKRNQYIKKYIEELVMKPNKVELDLYNNIEYNELVLEYKGNVEKAKEVFEENLKRKNAPLILEFEIINWIFAKNNSDVDDQCRKNMFYAIKELNLEALTYHTNAYRNININKAPFTINEFSSEVDFNNLAGEKEKIKAYFMNKIDAELKAIKDWPAYLGFGAGLASGIAGVSVNEPGLMAGTAMGAGFGAIQIYSNKNTRQKLYMQAETDITATTEIMEALFKEHQSFVADIKEFDNYVNEIIQLAEGM